MEKQKYPCPSCGFLVFDESVGSYDICPICGWEDDPVQLRHPMMKGGANGGSLFEYQEDILKEIPIKVKEHRGFTRCAKWHPLTESDLKAEDNFPRTGIDYFPAVLEDSPVYYWEDTNKE